MTTIFCIRPQTRNIGNDLIGIAASRVIRKAFGPEANIVNVPALRGPQFGGFTSAQVHDMNRLADAVVIGGGNLFENGQLTVDVQALEALRTPLAIIGVSHGRIFDADGARVDRTDAMAPAVVRRLAEKASLVSVRDHGSQAILKSIGVPDAVVGGCPTLFLRADRSPEPSGLVLLSLRHPARMSVPAALQWRTPEDVRRLFHALRLRFGDVVRLVCHDYADIEFAAAFPEARSVYFDEVGDYMRALQNCRLSISYRLHAFLPCLALGTPSINISYDGRGQDMVATSGMADWDVDLFGDDVVSQVMDRVDRLDDYARLRQRSTASRQELETITDRHLSEFAGLVQGREPASKAA